MLSPDRKVSGSQNRKAVYTNFYKSQKSRPHFRNSTTQSITNPNKISSPQISSRILSARYKRQNQTFVKDTSSSVTHIPRVGNHNTIQLNHLASPGGSSRALQNQNYSRNTQQVNQGHLSLAIPQQIHTYPNQSVNSISIVKRVPQQLEYAQTSQTYSQMIPKQNNLRKKVRTREYANTSGTNFLGNHIRSESPISATNHEDLFNSRISMNNSQIGFQTNHKMDNIHRDSVQRLSYTHQNSETSNQMRMSTMSSKFNTSDQNPSLQN